MCAVMKRSICSEGRSAFDRVDQDVGAAAAARGGQRDRGIAHPFGQAGVEVADGRGDLEAGRGHVGALGEGEVDVPCALRRCRADARISRDGREGPFDARGNVLFDQAGRGVGPRERDADRALRRRGGVLHVEPRQEGRTDHRQCRHDEQYGEGRDAAAPGGYVPAGFIVSGGRFHNRPAG